MNKTPTHYCTTCGKVGPVERKMRSIWFNIKVAMVHIEYPVLRCKSCGARHLEPGNHPADIAWAKYWEWGIGERGKST